jgi:hypothetical protein
MNINFPDIERVLSFKNELRKLFPESPIGVHGTSQEGYILSIFKDKKDEDPDQFLGVALTYAGNLYS